MLKEIISILRLFEALNGRGYIVGGYVRDMILGIPSKDIDIEVYGLSLDTIEHTIKLAGFKPKNVGKSFGVIKAGDYDFSLPRTEVKTGVGYTSFDITTDPFLSTVEACRRRDLTINAILYDPLEDAYIDHFNGISDLKKGIIRHIGDYTFAEDPLRILRVAQFTARFQFKIDPKTEELCKTLVSELTAISYERIFIELEKLLMKAVKPSIGFEFLHRIGALKLILPEVAILDTVEQGTKYHSEGNALKHTLMAIDNVKLKKRSIALMFAILLHDTGKALVDTVRNEDHISFHGHEKAFEGAETALTRLTTEKKLIEKVLLLVSHHMLPYQFAKKSFPSKVVRRLIAKGVDVELLAELHKADKLGRVSSKPDLSYVEEMLEKYNKIKDEVKPLILGRHLIDLGLKPGKEFGVILKKAFQAQLDEKFFTIEDGLVFVQETLI